VTTKVKSAEPSAPAQAGSEQSNIARISILQWQPATSAVNEHLKTLARILGRHAARSQLPRGRSILEIGLALAACAIVAGIMILAGR